MSSPWEAWPAAEGRCSAAATVSTRQCRVRRNVLRGWVWVKQQFAWPRGCHIVSEESKTNQPIIQYNKHHPCMTCIAAMTVQLYVSTISSLLPASQSAIRHPVSIFGNNSRTTRKNAKCHPKEEKQGLADCEWLSGCLE